MEVDMNNIDDILQEAGLGTPPVVQPSNAVADEEPPREETSSLTDADITDILEDNGIEESVFEGEGHEEEEEAYSLDEAFEAIEAETSFNENQGEGNDIAMEQEDPNYLNALANAEQEEDYVPEVNDSLEEAREDFNQAMEEHLESQSSDTEEEDEIPAQSIEEPSNPENARIPLNSPTLLMDETTARFSGTEWYNEIQKARIILGGCGGIGSNVAFQLARMIPANITIYDDDNVETVNMAGQLFSYADIGMSKVSAMANMINKYTPMRQVNALKQKFTEHTEAGDIMICGFDNMRARKIFFNSWFGHIKDKPMEDRAKCLLLDGRLSIDTLQILCIRGDDTYNINRYQSEFLFSDNQADATICSMKQTTYLACMIGSLMVNLFTNFVAGTLNPIMPYDLPFFTEYDAQNMIFKTES